MSSGASVLADRHPNGQISRPADKATFKPTDTRRHTNRSPTKENEWISASDTYISPSDNLMSPATYKLCQLRQKNYTAKPKPKTLFKKSNLSTSSMSMETADAEKDAAAFSFSDIAERKVSRKGTGDDDDAGV